MYRLKVLKVLYMLLEMFRRRHVLRSKMKNDLTGRGPATLLIIALDFLPVFIFPMSLPQHNNQFDEQHNNKVGLFTVHASTDFTNSLDP